MSTTMTSPNASLVPRIRLIPCDIHKDGCKIVIGEDLEEISHVNLKVANDTSTGWLDHILKTAYKDVGALKVLQCREDLSAVMAEYDQLSSNHQPTLSPDSTFDNVLPGLNQSDIVLDFPEMREVDRSYFADMEEEKEEEEAEEDTKYYDDTKPNEERLIDLQQVPLLDRDHEYHAEIHKIEKLMEVEREAAIRRSHSSYNLKDHFIQLENTPLNKRNVEYYALRGQVQALLDKEEAQATAIRNAIKHAASSFTLRSNTQTKSHTFPALNTLSIDKDLPELPSGSPEHHEHKIPNKRLSSSRSMMLLDSNDNIYNTPRLQRLHSIKSLASRSPIISTSKLLINMFKNHKKQLNPVSTTEVTMEADAKALRKKYEENGWGLSSGDTSEADNSEDDQEDTPQIRERVQRLKDYARSPIIMLKSS